MAEQAPTTDDLDRLPTNEELGRLQRTTVLYYLHETNPDNGLVRTRPTWPHRAASPPLVWRWRRSRSSLSAEFVPPVRGEDRAARLRSSTTCPQGPEPDASGHKGFFYHFLDMETGRRVWHCELSTLDSAFLFAGMLTAATYFDGDTADEADVRRLADALYRRADWDWARDGGPTLTHGWKPETGFMPHRYEGYDEGLLLYVLAWARRRTRCRQRATPPTAPRISGRRSTTASCFTPGRSSLISFRTCGSTSAASGTRSCASTAATTSRTAGKQPTCSRSTPSATRSNSPVTANTAGGSRPATDPAG